MTGASVASVRGVACSSLPGYALRPLSGVKVKSPFESIQIFLELLNPIGLAVKTEFSVFTTRGFCNV